MIDKLKNYFREDTSAIIGAYFDGEKIFITCHTEKLETIEVEADGSEIERLAEKISLVCKQKDWKASTIGFCLREGDAVTFQTEVDNIPEKELPALVKSWALAQAGAEVAYSFAKVGEELWMEAMPRVKVEEFCTAFRKFGMNLRGLSVMPTDMLTKIQPFDRTEFISGVVRNKKAPNLLAARDSVWHWKKISVVVAAIFFIVLLSGSAKLFLDYDAASDKLIAAKTSLDKFHNDLALKEIIDADIAELHRLNELSAQIEINKNFNHLINLGKLAGGGVHLTRIRVEEDFLELEGTTKTPAAIRNYLARVKASVIQTARLESSSERDDGDIVFVIRASL